MCKETNSKFIRLVMGAPEPMALLSFDWTLNDVSRFCTADENFSVLGIDPTFDLGAFHVTVTTYEHKFLYKANASSSNQVHPVMMGPMFIHQRKTFGTYHAFASNLIGLRPELRGTKAFGTDGENALSKAFALEFPGAIHLHCFLHFKDNIKSKLISDLKLPLPVTQEFWQTFLEKHLLFS